MPLSRYWLTRDTPIVGWWERETMARYPASVTREEYEKARHAGTTVLVLQQQPVLLQQPVLQLQQAVLLLEPVLLEPHNT